MATAAIEVRPAGGEVFDVEVVEGTSVTRHRVSVPEADRARYGGGASAEALVEASFHFLLEREPKESIMGAFDLPVIERYFPEYPELIGSLLERYDTR